MLEKFGFIVLKESNKYNVCIPFEWKLDMCVFLHNLLLTHILLSLAPICDHDGPIGPTWTNPRCISEALTEYQKDTIYGIYS